MEGELDTESAHICSSRYFFQKRLPQTGPTPQGYETVQPTDSPSGPATRPDKPSRPDTGEYTTPGSAGTIDLTGTGTVEPTVGTPAPQEREFKVVCYFTNWAWYRYVHQRRRKEILVESLRRVNKCLSPHTGKE